MSEIHSVAQGAGTVSYDAHVEQYRALVEVAGKVSGLAVVWSEDLHSYVLQPVRSSK